MIETRAVHLLGTGHIRQSNVKISVLTSEHLVTELGMLGTHTQLHCVLDLLHVGQVSVDGVPGLQNSVNNIEGLQQSSSK